MTIPLHLMTLDKLFTHVRLGTKWYNFIPSIGWWCYTVGQVTVD